MTPVLLASIFAVTITGISLKIYTVKIYKNLVYKIKTEYRLTTITCIKIQSYSPVRFANRCLTDADFAMVQCYKDFGNYQSIPIQGAAHLHLLFVNAANPVVIVQRGSIYLRLYMTIKQRQTHNFVMLRYTLPDPMKLKEHNQQNSTPLLR
uniref:Phlebovirus_G2 domain-containing protein n=1 Tax=Heterorhabditis bacteriophora TaxID=37862 RepID=A0A1I7WUZ0_HETBA